MREAIFVLGRWFAILNAESAAPQALETSAMVVFAGGAMGKLIPSSLSVGCFP
jgi:hypothetical protein